VRSSTSVAARSGSAGCAATPACARRSRRSTSAAIPCFPKDLFTNAEDYRDAIIFGSLFDHNKANGDLILVNAASLAIEEANASGLTEGRSFGIVHCDYQENEDIDELTSRRPRSTARSTWSTRSASIGIIGPGTSGLAEAVFKELQKPEHDPHRW
jgi:hypothetical protein